MKNIQKIYDIFKKECLSEGINDVDLKISKIPSLFDNGNTQLKIKDGKIQYTIKLNLSNDRYDEEIDYYLTMFHELEHIKTLKMTKQEDYYNFEHIISLLEYIYYLKKANIPFDNIKKNLILKINIANSMRKNYCVSTGEIQSTLMSYQKLKEYKLSEKNEFDSIIRTMEFLKENMQVYYDERNIPRDKFGLFVLNTTQYINAYPKILEEYKILNNFFNKNGTVKDVYEIYQNINNKNKVFNDKFIIGLLSNFSLDGTFEKNINTDVAFKEYIENIIAVYMESVTNYYKNMSLGNVFISKDKYLYDNLEILTTRVEYLNNIIKTNCLVRKKGIIFQQKR